MKQLSQECLRMIIGGQAQAAVAAASRSNVVEVVATAGAIGAGYGASVAIEAAGGLAAMGSAAIGAATAFTGGLAATALAGAAVGTYAYNHSETVQDAAQAVVGWVVESFQGISDYYDGIGEHSCTYGSGGKPGSLEADVSQI